VTVRALEDLAQGLRKAHCSRGDNELHDCVGKVTITSGRVDLECTKCGNGHEIIAPSETLPQTRLAKRVLAAVGLDWDALTPERKRAASDAAGSR
jgi:hypothetical protein